MENNFFSPNPIVVDVGDTITWTNSSGTPHTTTDGARGDPQAGGVWDHAVLSGASSPAVTFNTAGTFPYFCRLHFGMDGTITVQEAATMMVDTNQHLLYVTDNEEIVGVVSSFDITKESAKIAATEMVA